MGITWALTTPFFAKKNMAHACTGSLGENTLLPGITKHPTGVVVQTSVNEWLRWLTSLSDFLQVTNG